MSDLGAPSNNEMQLTGGEGGARQWGSPFGEPVERSRRQASPPAADLGVRQTLGKARQLRRSEGDRMNQFTAVVERDGEWFVAYCPEIPGANGQGHTKEEAIESLSGAIALILEDRREDGLRGLPADAVRETVIVK